MNIADAHLLKPLFKASKISHHNPVLARFKRKYFVGYVLPKQEEEPQPPNNHFDIQWYKPHHAGLGYKRETLFVPSFTKCGALICDFVHENDAFYLGEFIEKRNPYGHEFKFSKSLHEIVNILHKRTEILVQEKLANIYEGIDDEETITEEEDSDEETNIRTPPPIQRQETDNEESESEELPEEKDSDWEGEDEEESEDSDEVYAKVTRSRGKKRSPPSEKPPSPKRQKVADGTTREQMSVANLLNTSPPPSTENQTDSRMSIGKLLNTPSYPTEGKKKDVYKQQINDILAHLGRQTRMLCHALNPSEPSCALFLDADDARTTHTMFNTGGYRLENMFAPNYSQQVVDSIQRNTRALPGKINTPCLLMEEFTLEKTDRKFSFVWVDGCGSWKGSGMFSTQNSVLNLFRHKLLDAHSVVAYTINMRGKKGNQVSRAHTEMAMSYRQIKMVAEQNGYTVEHKPKLHHIPTSHGDLPNCGQNFTAYMRVWK
jgi:hypothetical protein